MGRLSDARIRSLKPAERDRWIGDGNGLWLRVRTTGTKVFVIRSKRGGRVRVVTLGAWPHYGLGKARLEAAKVAHDRAGAALPHASANLTVRELAEEYYEARIVPHYRRVKNARVYRDRLARELGWRKLRDVQPVHIADVAKAYARERRVAANRFLAFVKGAFDFARESGYLEHNPAAGLSRKVAGGAERARERVLSDAEIRRLWHTEGEHVRLLRFLLVTGVRIGEAQLAAWSRLDLAARRWTIPAEHAKNKRAHWVYLPDLAIDILGATGKPAGLALRSASETAVQAWLRRWCEREEIAPRFTPHDLRRTFATRLGALGIAPHVVAKLLNHTLQGSEEISRYLRDDYARERIEALERWAAELARIVAGATK
jgi:integrase